MALLTAAPYVMVASMVASVVRRAFEDQAEGVDDCCVTRGYVRAVTYIVLSMLLLTRVNERV